MATIFHGPKHLMTDLIKEVIPQQEESPLFTDDTYAQQLSAPIELKQLAMESLSKDAIKIETIYVDKIVEVIKEVPVETIKEIRIIEEKIIQVPVIQYVETIVEKIVEKPVEVIKEIEKFIDKEIKIIPLWIKAIVIIQSLLIIGLIIK